MPFAPLPSKTAPAAATVNKESAPQKEPISVPPKVKPGKPDSAKKGQNAEKDEKSERNGSESVSKMSDRQKSEADKSKQTSKAATPLDRPKTKDHYTEAIFKDGTLIMRDGSIVRSASILSDGSVKLKDGSTMNDVCVVLDNGQLLTDAKIMRDGTILKDGSIVTVGKVIRSRENTLIKEESKAEESGQLEDKKGQDENEKGQDGQKKEDQSEAVVVEEKPKTALQLLKEQMEEKRKSSKFCVQQNNKIFYCIVVHSRIAYLVLFY